MGPSEIYWLLLGFYSLSSIWDIYLLLRQLRVYKSNERRPEIIAEIISEDDFNKARGYKIEKMHFGLFSMVFFKILMLASILSNIFPWSWQLSTGMSRLIWLNSGEKFSSVLFVFISSFVETFISLPFSFYDSFVIEQRHGFNKKTVSFFFLDTVKKFVVGMLLSVPMILGILWIIEVGGPHFYLYVWLFITVLIFVLATVYPEFIAPLFDKYILLPECELKSGIEKLASRLDFPLKKIYVVQGSKRSAHSNAYLFGFWKNKRIVIYDTLLNKEMNEILKEKFGEKQKAGNENLDQLAQDESEKDKNNAGGLQDDEVLAILGHEFGHWKLSHTIWNLVLSEINIFFMLLIFAYFYQQQNIYTAFGFNSKPTFIGLIIILQFVLSPFHEINGILMNFLSRYFEFSADRFSAELGYASHIKSGLIKLGKDNLSFPIDDKLYSLVTYSHPPITERIDALKKFE